MCSVRRGHANPSRTTLPLDIADGALSTDIGVPLAGMVGELPTRAPGRIRAGGDDEAGRRRGTAGQQRERGAEPFRAPRILIVEDEWFIAIESEAALRDAGYDVVGIAVSAEEAVELADRHRPDLILMDIRLRGPRDGVDAAREIRKRFDVPCLFATAHSEQGVREHAETATPAGWLAKPFSDRQLVAAVRSALGVE